MRDAMKEGDVPSKLEALGLKVLQATNGDAEEAAELFYRGLLAQPALLFELFSKDELEQATTQALAKLAAEGPPDGESTA